VDIAIDERHFPAHAAAHRLLPIRDTRREIVALDLPQARELPPPDAADSSHLSPQAWRALIAGGCAVLLDNRKRQYQQQQRSVQRSLTSAVSPVQSHQGAHLLPGNRLRGPQGPGAISSVAAWCNGRRRGVPAPIFWTLRIHPRVPLLHRVIALSIQVRLRPRFSTKSCFGIQWAHVCRCRLHGML
jgi:hypothetical protein